MSKFKKRITKLEKVLSTNDDWVNVNLYYGESQEEAMARHLKNHPEDKEAKNFLIITNYGDKNLG